MTNRMRVQTGSSSTQSQPLPLHFALLTTYAFRFDAPLVPVLYVRYPEQHGDPEHHVVPPVGSNSPSLNTRSIDVVRILDPEHREPFVSLGRLLALIEPVTLSPLAALNILNELGKNSDPLKPLYSLLLNGLAPFPDLWVTLPHAREFAKRCGLLGEHDGGLLAHLLSWETKAIWSVVTLSSARTPVRTGELVSNWRVPEEILPLEDYSLGSLQDSTFTTLELTPRTIGEDGLLRLPLTVPAPDPLKPPAFRTFPDTLLAEICLLSADASTGRSESELGSRISRCLESLSALILGQYRSPSQETDPPGTNDQIEALGLILYSVWRSLLPVVVAPGSSLSSSSASDESSDGSEARSERPLQPDQPLALALERIEARLDQVLRQQRPTRSELSGNLLDSRWVWIGLIVLAYLLGSSHRDP